MRVRRSVFSHFCSSPLSLGLSIDLSPLYVLDPFSLACFTTLSVQFWSWRWAILIWLCLLFLSGCFIIALRRGENLGYIQNNKKKQFFAIYFYFPCHTCNKWNCVMETYCITSVLPNHSCVSSLTRSASVRPMIFSHRYTKLRSRQPCVVSPCFSSQYALIPGLYWVHAGIKGHICQVLKINIPGCNDSDILSYCSWHQVFTFDGFVFRFSEILSLNVWLGQVISCAA